MGDPGPDAPRLAVDHRTARPGAQRGARDFGAGAAGADRGRVAGGYIEQGFEVHRRGAGEPRFIAAAQQAGPARIGLDDTVVDERAGAGGKAKAERRFFGVDREVERHRAGFAAKGKRWSDGDPGDVTDIAEDALETGAG